MDWLLYENDARQKGYKNICGVDEAGRGPLAGPVCAAAVILPEGCIIEGVNDSKKLTEKKREALFDVIIETAISCSVAFGTVEEIERDNILAATMNTMRRAVEGLSVKADYAMIDGNRLPKLDIPAQTIVGGDAKSMSIAAASILAKVTRDRLMLEYCGFQVLKALIAAHSLADTVFVVSGAHLVDEVFCVVVSVDHYHFSRRIERVINMGEHRRPQRRKGSLGKRQHNHRCCCQTATADK